MFPRNPSTVDANKDILSSISELSSAAWAYTALSAAIELGVVNELDSPVTAAELGDRLGVDAGLVTDMLGVLAALGAVERSGDRFSATPAFETFRSGSLAQVMRAGIRSDHLQTAEAFGRARDGDLAPGWSHLDPDVLVAQGETAGLFRLAAEFVLPSLEGLRERLERPGARFLDVGAGVGVLSGELCRVYPMVESVCLEPNEVAAGIGSRRLASAGLADRVGYRLQSVQQLDHYDAFDLAVVPQPFLSPQSFERGLPRVLEALRPGGWLVVLALDTPDEEPLAAAARRFRARLWGGGAIPPQDLLARLRTEGFLSAHMHPPVGAYRMFAARRAPVDARSRVSEREAGTEELEQVGNLGA